MRAPFRFSVGLVAASLVMAGGFLSQAQASDKSDCGASKPVSVYTDGLAHYVGACGPVGYVQLNEPGSGSLVETSAGQLPAAPVAVVDKQKCSSAPVVVFTDNLNHFVGLCIAGQFLRVDELMKLGGGKFPVSSGTGTPLDGLLAGLPPISIQTNQILCTIGGGDVLQVYTDALQHVVGACDGLGDSVRVQDIPGALVGSNNILSIRVKGLFTLNIQTQVKDGSGVNLLVLHPRIEFIPEFAAPPVPVPVPVLPVP